MKMENELTFDQAGEIFSELLVEYADKCLDLIKNQLANDKEKNPIMNDKKEMQIKKLFLFFFIHFIDRRAFSILTPENRKKLMNPIGYMSVEGFIKNNINNFDNINQDNLLRNHLEELNAFVLKFNKFKKIIPSKGESPKDTLFWEFSKEISLTIDNTTDIVYMTIANELISQVISNLKIDEIVEIFK
jgi:hypothetical protein